MVYNILFCEQETVWLLHDNIRESESKLAKSLEISSYKIWGLMPPGRGFLCFGVVMKWTCNISSPLLVYTGAWIGRVGYKAALTGEGSVWIVNFISIGDGGLVLGRGYVGHYIECALYSALSVCITLIAVVLRKYDAAFLCHCWFSFILWWGSWCAGMGPSGEGSVWSHWCLGGPWALRPLVSQRQINAFKCVCYFPI